MGGIQKVTKAKRLRRRRAATLAALAAPWLTATQSAGAHQTEVAVGACVMTLDVTGNYALTPPVPPVGPATLLTINGNGTCVVNGELEVRVTVGGTLKSLQDVPTWSCLGGIARGRLTFDVTHDEFSMPASADVIVVAGGSAMAMVAVGDEGDSVFGGAGQFVQDESWLTSCPTTASAVTTTWCGAFEFVWVLPEGLPVD